MTNDQNSKKPPTLEDSLIELEDQMEKVENEMQASGMPVVSIVYTNRVLRPAYELMIRAHAMKTPIPELDEAIVATIASIMDDYLKRVHAKGKLPEALSHFTLVMEDIAERVTQQIDHHFTDRSIIVPRRTH